MFVSLSFCVSVCLCVHGTSPRNFPLPAGLGLATRNQVTNPWESSQLKHWNWLRFHKSIQSFKQVVKQAQVNKRSNIKTFPRRNMKGSNQTKFVTVPLQWNDFNDGYRSTILVSSVLQTPVCNNCSHDDTRNRNTDKYWILNTFQPVPQPISS